MNELIKCTTVSGQDVWICLQCIKYIWESEIAHSYEINIGGGKSITIDRKSFKKICTLMGA
jgi:hypothetical protein